MVLSLDNMKTNVASVHCDAGSSKWPIRRSSPPYSRDVHRWHKLGCGSWGSGWSHGNCDDDARGELHEIHEFRGEGPPNDGGDELRDVGPPGDNGDGESHGEDDETRTSDDDDGTQTGDGATPGDDGGHARDDGIEIESYVLHDDGVLLPQIHDEENGALRHPQQASIPPGEPPLQHQQCPIGGLHSEIRGEKILGPGLTRH